MGRSCVIYYYKGTLLTNQRLDYWLVPILLEGRVSVGVAARQGTRERESGLGIVFMTHVRCQSFEESIVMRELLAQLLPFYKSPT